MSAMPNVSRKRSKKRYYAGNYNKRPRGPRELEVGMQGILITCGNNQRKQCIAEALNLLGEYADNLYGPEMLEDHEAMAGNEYDVEAALHQEVAQLKAFKEKRARRFEALDSGASNVIFIKTLNLEPEKLVHYILSDLHTTKKEKSRVILRMLPVSGTCRAFQEDIERYLPMFLKPWFKTPRPITYQVAFKARNSSLSKRDDIIKSIAGVVGRLNRRNKVDLSNPEFTIIVEVIKVVCCVSVVPDYKLYRKYNIQEVVKEDISKSEVTTAKEDTSMTNPQEKQEVVSTEQEEKQNNEKEGEAMQEEKQNNEKEGEAMQEEKQNNENEGENLQKEKQNEEKEGENVQEEKQKEGENVQEEKQEGENVQEKQNDEGDGENVLEEKQTDEEEGTNLQEEKQNDEKEGGNVQEKQNNEEEDESVQNNEEEDESVQNNEEEGATVPETDKQVEDDNKV